MLRHNVFPAIFNPIASSLNLYHPPNTSMLQSFIQQIVAGHLLSTTVLDPVNKVLALRELRKRRYVSVEVGQSNSQSNNYV